MVRYLRGEPRLHHEKSSNWRPNTLRCYIKCIHNLYSWYAPFALANGPLTLKRKDLTISNTIIHIKMYRPMLCSKRTNPCKDRRVYLMTCNYQYLQYFISTGRFKNGEFGSCDCPVACSYTQFESSISYGLLPSYSVADDLYERYQLNSSYLE